MVMPSGENKFITWNEDEVNVEGLVYCSCCEKSHPCPNRHNHKVRITKYWRVQIHILGEGTQKRISKSFNPKKYGSKKKALQEAIKWRDNTLKERGELWRLIQ